MPARGNKYARLIQAHLVDAYGQQFWDIVYMLQDSPGEPRTGRIGFESSYDDPRPGDWVIISFIAGQPAGLYKTD